MYAITVLRMKTFKKDQKKEKKKKEDTEMNILNTNWQTRKTPEEGRTG